MCAQVPLAPTPASKPAIVKAVDDKRSVATADSNPAGGGRRSTASTVTASVASHDVGDAKSIHTTLSKASAQGKQSGTFKAQDWLKGILSRKKAPEKPAAPAAIKVSSVVMGV